MIMTEIQTYLKKKIESNREAKRKKMKTFYENNS